MGISASSSILSKWTNTTEQPVKEGFHLTLQQSRNSSQKISRITPQCTLCVNDNGKERIEVATGKIWHHPKTSLPSSLFNEEEHYTTIFEPSLVWFDWKERTKHTWTLEVLIGVDYHIITGRESEDKSISVDVNMDVSKKLKSHLIKVLVPPAEWIEGIAAGEFERGHEIHVPRLGANGAEEGNIFHNVATHLQCFWKFRIQKSSSTGRTLEPSHIHYTLHRIELSFPKEPAHLWIAHSISDDSPFTASPSKRKLLTDSSTTNSSTAAASNSSKSANSTPSHTRKKSKKAQGASLPQNSTPTAPSYDSLYHYFDHNTRLPPYSPESDK